MIESRILVLLIIFMFIAINYVNKILLKVNYKIMNPLFLMIAVWTLALAAHALYFRPESYTSLSYIMIFLGVISFAIGFCLTGNKTIVSSKLKSYNYDYNALKRLIVLLTIIQVVRLIYIIIIVFNLAGSVEIFFNSNTLVRNRYLARNTSSLLNIFEFFTNANALVAYVLVGIYSAKKCKGWKSIALIWTITEVLYAIVSMSKMCLILFLIVIGVTYLNNIGDKRIQKKVFTRCLPIMSIGMFLFLLLIALQRNYSALGGSIVETVLKKAIFYFSSGIEALGKYIELYGSQVEMGSNTFSIFARIFSRLGIISNTNILSHADYIETMHEITNVYTWFRVFFLDFSYIGFIIVPLVIGFISGIFYNPNRHNLFLDVCSSWISTIIVMSFYAFLWGQTIYVFVLFYAYILHKLLIKRIYKIQ